MSNDATQPRVSVIIPNYQHEKFLERRMQSVLEQSFQDFEIILLDDASTDGSAEIIKRYLNHPKVSHVNFNEINTGKPFLQWKRGVELSRGSLIWIAESDDDAKPEFLATMVKAFEQIPDLVYATTMLERVDEDGQSLGLVEENFRETYNGMDILAKGLGYRNCIHNASAVVFDKRIGMTYINEITSYHYSGDWYFWALMAMHPGGRIHFSPFHLCLYRLHRNSVHGRVRGYRKSASAIERFRILYNINLCPAAACVSTSNIRKFIALNSNPWFWIYGVPSNFDLFKKLFLRPGYCHLLAVLMMAVIWGPLIKLRNRAYRYLSYMKTLC